MLANSYDKPGDTGGGREMNRRHFCNTALAVAVSAAIPWNRALAADEIPAMTGSGTKTALARSDLQQLKESLRGPLLLPGDADYDQARRVLNESIDKRPALIVQPTGAADVQTAVNFAREHELLVAVKCGGHSYAGKSTCDGGMQIDLSRLRSARVDPAARVAYIAGGSLLGELDHEAMAFGLVTTAGTVSHTGVGGLTLGGGFGRLARRFGLALDNVRAVDVVTAHGKLLHASADENPDLYWGVRGGGGNFGIVTSFEFELHPMQRQVIGGSIVFPIDRGRELLRVYRDYSLGAPEDLYVDAIMTAPAGKPGGFIFDVCYSGPADKAEAVLMPLRKLGKPIADSIKPMDYTVLQRRNDRTDPRNEGQYLKSGFLDRFDDAVIDAIMDGFEPAPGRNTTVFFQHAGGAISRVPVQATAFPHRRATHNMFATVSWPLASDSSTHVGYIKGYWPKLQRYTDGYYTNETFDEGQRVLDDNYQGNLPRLREVKRKYDPGNLFRLNANVLPAA
jgi:FAD/FMN-containing dehydrogenase